MYLDWKSRPEDYYVIDIETDGLDPTVIHVMCWRNVKTNITGECVSYETIKQFFKDTQGSFYIGHNILKYDAPVLERLIGVHLPITSLIDTLVLSTLYSPSIEGGHSLDAWGERIGVSKINFSDWSCLSPEMIKYCHRDVELTTVLYRRLVSTLLRIRFSHQSIWIQHHLTVLIEEQRRNGFEFDGPRALTLYRELRQKEKELEQTIRKVFTPKRLHLATRRMYKKDGSFTAIYLKDRERYETVESSIPGEYEVYDTIEFNIGSPNQRVEKLLELGWEPEEFTDKGNPKPFDKGSLSPSLEEFLTDTPTPEVELIAKWMAFNGRANMINTWLENWDEVDGRIHGKLYVANTLRFRHQAPNTANIPAVRIGKDGGIQFGEKGFYTYESRDLWIARPGRVLVGTDAAGLELRVLAHYLNRPAFTEQVLEGDPHQYNADTVGITRPEAKTLLYSIMYGAQARKIAKTLKIGLKEATEVREAFLARLGIGDLITSAQTEQRLGRIELIDGSQVVCPSPHAALNYKFQGSGARIMALSSILAKRQIVKRKLDVLKVGDIHDEDQSDCRETHAEEFGQMRVWTIQEAGRLLKTNIPLDGTYKIGRTWAETH